MKSQTKIKQQLRNKKNTNLKEVVVALKKQEAWKPVAAILAGPKSNWICVNIQKISDIAKTGETIVVPGKVLSLGTLDKKCTIVAVAFSEQARYKIKKAGSDAIGLADAFANNPEGKGIKVYQ